MATVTVDLRHTVAEFAPDRALGAGVDGHARGETAQIYTSPNLAAMRSAGFRPLAYRLRTELAVEAWHWNPRGRWSDPVRHQGYWTSSSGTGPSIGTTYGYRLPRRGNTVDQANDDGYSRLDDGDRTTFWKSNPYLDPHFAHATATEQWMFVDLRRHRPVDALRLDWGAPYARRLRVEYWAGGNADFTAGGLDGRWQAFPRSRFRGHPGSQTLHLTRVPLDVRFLRVVLAHSSHTAPRGATDIRDRLGFAVRELYVGRLVRGRFDDLMQRGPTNRQTPTYVSSTDPWHRAVDRDPGVEQPGLDRVLRSGLAGRRGLMLSAPLLYGTPEDSAGLLRYLHARRRPVARVELGEEPDGQLATPEDYGGLYLQFARALRRVDRRVVLGGPGFATSIPTWEAWPDRHGSTSWIARFLAVLRARRALGELGFFSFEWYPFDDVCARPGTQLVQEPELLAEQLRGIAADGVRRVPVVISEYGYSAFAGRSEVDLAGALLNADIVGQFLSLRGSAAYLYGYEPGALMRESPHCNTWGQLALLQADQAHRILHRLATYAAARLVTSVWALPGDGTHRVLAAAFDAGDTAGRAPPTVYAVRRPDGHLALMLINKDPTRSYAVRLLLRDGRGRGRGAGALDLFQLSERQYRWHPAGPDGYPDPDLPPVHRTLRGAAARVVELPPFSLSVLRTRGRLTIA